MHNDNARQRSAPRILKTVLFFAILGFIVFCVLAGHPCQGKGEKQTKKMQQSPQPEYGFNNVVEKAKRLSSAAYEDPRGKMPQWLLDITYDQLRDIRFIPASLFGGKKTCRLSSSFSMLNFILTAR